MSDSVTDQFEQSRPRLKAIAYRMLGSTVEADDAVQEAWIRLNRTGVESIDNLGGWLTTVVSRVCLDMLRSRRSRREEPVGAGLPTGTDVAGHPSDEPDHDVLLVDSLGPALVMVLDSLDPHERLSFVLHDLFGVPFAEIAPIVGRSADATRQMASRARRRLQADRGGPATAADVARQRELVDAFLAASRHGDFDALLELLDPDVVLRADDAAVRAAIANQGRGAPPLQPKISGRDAVARTLVGRAAGAQPALVDGVAGAVWAPGGQPRAIFAFRSEEGRIVEIEVIVDRRRIRGLEIAL